jgi:hypothetical protein
MESECQNRHAIMSSLDPTTLDRLLTMMYNINPYVEVFKMAVTTLILGLQPRQRGCKVAGQEEALESHHILPGV